MTLLEEHTKELYAWVILPNHYHALLKTNDVLSLLKQIHQLHGRTSFYWNGEENKRGRRVWCNSLEKTIKSDRHFEASINYIHHNPVKHEYVERWTDWPYSSLEHYITKKGTEQLLEDWNEYDISEMGNEWDAF